MSFTAKRLCCALLLLAGLALCGCLPSPQSQLDEEKEPHFLTGKERASALDYKGAVEAFEKALEANPRSSSAHFELGCLFDQKEPDPAAAIYHYEHYLKLRPDAENTEIVKQHIMACKQELAKSVSLAPVTERVQRDFEQLSEEAKRLAEQNKRLQEDLDKWRAYASRLETLTNLPRSRVSGTTPPPQGGGILATSTGYGKPAVLATPVGRTHEVKPGETPSGIAKQYGVKLEALMAANPNLNPRRLRVGQALAIPASSP
jgi:LysM repeat protein